MRARRCYKTPITQKVSIQKRNAIIISDEENTSEYSHSPSSQHSTLESNPDMPEALQKMKIAANTNVTGNQQHHHHHHHHHTSSKISTTTTTTTTTTDSESSESSEAESGDDEDVSYDLPTVSSSTANTTTATTTTMQPRQPSFSKKKSSHNQLVRDSNNASFKQKQLANSAKNRHNKSDIISIPTYDKDGAINMV